MERRTQQNEPLLEPPPPRGYLASTASTLWTAFQALLRGLVRTADDSRVSVAASNPPRPILVDREGRPRSPGVPAALPAAAGGAPARDHAERAAAAAATAGPPLCPLGAPPPPGHQHGALVGLAEELREKTLLTDEAAAKPAVALAHKELQPASADPFHRALVAPS